LKHLIIVKFLQGHRRGDFAKSSVRKGNDRNERVLDDVMGNAPPFVVREYSMVLIAKYGYSRLPGGVFDPGLSPGTKELERNACDLFDGSSGGWTPLPEILNKVVFDGVMISFLIPPRMPSDDSLKGNGSQVGPNLSLSAHGIQPSAFALTVYIQFPLILSFLVINCRAMGSTSMNHGDGHIGINTVKD
jgi:hypothetical protein